MLPRLFTRRTCIGLCQRRSCLATLGQHSSCPHGTDESQTPTQRQSPSRRAGTTAAANSQSQLAEKDFNPKKVLLLRKMTRYDFERRNHRHISESTLKELLNKKGSDYQGLVTRHDEYNHKLDQIYEILVKRGLDVNVARRQDYSVMEIEDTDAIFTAGGDGTFLMAAAKVKGHDKPVIGVNTDPVRSEGKLCLSKNDSVNFADSLDRILNGKFKWTWRNRIRIILSGHHADETPVNLHDQELMYPEYRYWEHVRENEMYFGDSTKRVRTEVAPPRVLPILALNEVFIGESLAARVSFYELSIDGSLPLKQKSSGLTVCTGTGSTSWFFNINHVPACSIKYILERAKDLSLSTLEISEDLCEKVATTFNNSLTFEPSELKMAFAVRDPIGYGIFQVTEPRGFCRGITVRSRMWDAFVAVDGGLSFRFNDGAHAELEMHEEDALRCVSLN